MEQKERVNSYGNMTQSDWKCKLKLSDQKMRQNGKQ